MNPQKTLVERQGAILNEIVRQYIVTAEPVGSATIGMRSSINVSPATIRNDMASLEDEGFLESRHISSGRVPTEKAYRYYINNFLQDVDLSKSEERQLRAVWGASSDINDTLKKTAKVVASFASEGVFLAFGRNDIYYTGLANLFTQPEFREYELLYQMGAMIDHLDEVIATIFDKISTDNIDILVGSDSPFGSGCSAILTRYNLPSSGEGLFGIVGPTRMDYEANIARASYVQEEMRNNK